MVFPKMHGLWRLRSIFESHSVNVHAGTLGIAFPIFLPSPLPWIRYQITAVIIIGFNSPCGEGESPGFGTDFHNLQEKEISEAG